MKSRDLCISALITRTDADGDTEELDVLVYFKVESHTAGCPARIRYDENDHPEEPEEWEFSFLRAEIDTPAPSDAPLTDAEIAGLRVWFETEKAQDKAATEAGEDLADDDGPDSDEYRDRAFDRELSGADSWGDC